jgi:hypothetical protein
MHIGYPFKSFCQPCPHFFLPGISIAARPGSSGHVEDTILCEIAHDGIQIVAVECFQESLQQLGGHLLGHWNLHVRTLIEKDRISQRVALPTGTRLANLENLSGLQGGPAPRGHSPNDRKLQERADPGRDGCIPGDQSGDPGSQPGQRRAGQNLLKNRMAVHVMG